MRIGGSVVEFSPATRVTRVRFPADANVFDAKTHYVNENVYLHLSTRAPNFNSRNLQTKHFVDMNLNVVCLLMTSIEM